MFSLKTSILIQYFIIYSCINTKYYYIRWYYIDIHKDITTMFPTISFDQNLWYILLNLQISKQFGIILFNVKDFMF